MAITKAVIPVAGLGTRFLPATKALPKEMLPVIDKPAIQYVVEEAVRSQLFDILLVTGRNKNALENHFDRAVELETLLEEKGETLKLKSVSETTDLANIHYVRQGDPLGLGHAVGKAKSFVGGEPFALLLGDDLIEENEDLLKRMIELAELENANVIALQEVEEKDVHKYGIASVSKHANGFVKINGLVEKPQAEVAPSRYAVIGRYVLQPEVFDVISQQMPGLAGEIQLTDVLNVMANDYSIAGPVVGIIFNGKRYDTGDKISYLKAIIEIALGRNDLGEELKIWLQSIIGKTDQK